MFPFPGKPEEPAPPSRTLPPVTQSPQTPRARTAHVLGLSPHPPRPGGRGTLASPETGGRGVGVGRSKRGRAGLLGGVNNLEVLEGTIGVCLRGPKVKGIATGRAGGARSSPPYPRSSDRRRASRPGSSLRGGGWGEEGEPLRLETRPWVRSALRRPFPFGVSTGWASGDKVEAPPRGRAVGEVSPRDGRNPTSVPAAGRTESLTSRDSVSLSVKRVFKGVVK